MQRNASSVDILVPHYRRAISEFIGLGSLNSSSLIVDGPGLGCGNHGLILALLGPDRLSKLGTVHFFSASGYAAFFFHAKQCDKLKLRRHEVGNWNRLNQHRHNIKPGISALGFLWKKLAGMPWCFRNHLLADALRVTVTEDYAKRAMLSMPANHHFWTYDITDKKFCDIHANSDYSHWTIADVISSLTAVPGIFEPFEKDGHTYSDAIRGPGIKELYRELRSQSQSVLFWHMNREGRKEHTLYIKGHQSKNGFRRIFGDFILFFFGIDNPEFSRAIELSLFDLDEVTLSEH